MTRHVKLVNGQEVEMTEDEISARVEREAAYEAAKPLAQWQARMAATDAKVTARIIEDAIDGIQSALAASGVSLSNHLPDTVINVMSERKTIRQQKPRSE